MRGRMNEVVLTSFCQVTTPKDKEKVKRYLLGRFDSDTINKFFPRLALEMTEGGVKSDTSK